MWPVERHLQVMGKRQHKRREVQRGAKSRLKCRKSLIEIRCLAPEHILRQINQQVPFHIQHLRAAKQVVVLIAQSGANTQIAAGEEIARFAEIGGIGQLQR